jgi:hypothetical protein
VKKKRKQLPVRNPQWHKLKYIVFFLAGILSFWVIIFLQSHVYGDGFEYLGMTISMSNHGTSELRDTDITERRELVTQHSNNGWNLPAIKDHEGYFLARNGNEYSYHFWLYSALCVPFFIILKTLGANPLNVFMAVNIILILFLFWWIIYRARLDSKSRIWLIIFSLISPVLLYIPWSHPEVFIYIFLLIGLIEVVYGNIALGSLLIAISSTQGQPVAIIAGAALVYQFWQFKTKRLPLNPSNIALTLAAAFILILPYAFYWLNFGRFSLIAGGSESAASLQAITFSKIVSLFLDPNFGFIIYVPLLLVALVLLLIKRKPLAIMGLIFLIAFATISATQKNWNSGMTYINRYAIWVMPVLIVATLGYFGQLNPKRLKIFIIVLLVTTGITTSVCLMKQQQGNCDHFGPVARVVLAIAPSIYNPPFEVFAERTMEREGTFSDQLPLELVNSNGLRKSLELDASGNGMVYRNGPFQLTSDFNLKRLFEVNSNSDILNLSGKASFISGWYPLETNSGGQKWRWTNQNIRFGFQLAAETTSAQIRMSIASFLIPRNCRIYINGKECSNSTISTSVNIINFQAVVKPGMNCLEIMSSKAATKPGNSPELKNPDNRDLTFAISNIQITPDSS